MDAHSLFERYRELQSYVGWTDEDRERVAAVGPRVAPWLPAIIDDFYAEIERHPNARAVITGGQAQISRLKGTLLRWVQELLAGQYDADYVARRWRVGGRHVEIGLDQVYTNVALSRLRTGLARAVEKSWEGEPDGYNETIHSLDKLLDLDLAIIEDAYQSEFTLRLQRSERLATLGQVAGGIAHELRNPLNVIKTSVYYLTNARNPTPEKQGEHLCRIERQVGLADGVITALSNFARMPVPSLVPTSVGPCLLEALEASPPGRSVTVEIDVPESLPPALADADQLRIVFRNLIQNARDAMPEGGRLLIAARACEGVLEVTVTDTGTGIPESDLARITEPLYSTKARGLGLGLAIVRAILDKGMGGLRVESQQGVGSTFTVRLMAAPGKEPTGGRDGESA
jgi:signal transduction histidine kinase